MSFRLQLKIRFADIDRAGIVYYPRFFNYFHVAIEEFFGSQLNIEYHVLIDQYRIGLPTVHLETDFKKPFSFGDTIEVEIGVRQIGHSSITFGFQMFKPGETEPRSAGHNVVVCMDMDTFHKREIPDWLRERLEHYLLPNR